MAVGRLPSRGRDRKSSRPLPPPVTKPGPSPPFPEGSSGRSPTGCAAAPSNPPSRMRTARALFPHPSPSVCGIPRARYFLSLCGRPRPSPSGWGRHWAWRGAVRSPPRPERSVVGSGTARPRPVPCARPTWAARGQLERRWEGGGGSRAAARGVRKGEREGEREGERGTGREGRKEEGREGREKEGRAGCLQSPAPGAAAEPQPLGTAGGTRCPARFPAAALSTETGGAGGGRVPLPRSREKVRTGAHLPGARRGPQPHPVPAGCRPLVPEPG